MKKPMIVMKRIIAAIVIVIILIMIGLPFFWMISTSFKPPIEWSSSPPVWIPGEFYWQNYREMWVEGGDNALVNTVIIGIGSSFAAIIVGSLCGYSISRFKTGGNTLMFFILAIRLLPAAVIIVPIIMLYSLYHLIDTRLGLILLYTLSSLPFTVYLMKTFFDGIPRDIEDAAQVDGCSPIQTFIRVALPLSTAGLAVSFLFALVLSWNELFFAVTLTRTQAITIPVKLASWYNSNTGNFWGPQAAQAIVAIVPMVFIATLVQKWIVKGLTLGAVKY
jgi:multiple sugar transport system permease protein